MCPFCPVKSTALRLMTSRASDLNAAKASLLMLTLCVLSVSRFRCAASEIDEGRNSPRRQCKFAVRLRCIKKSPKDQYVEVFLIMGSSRELAYQNGRPGKRSFNCRIKVCLVEIRRAVNAWRFSTFLRAGSRNGEVCKGLRLA